MFVILFQSILDSEIHEVRGPYATEAEAQHDIDHDLSKFEQEWYTTRVHEVEARKPHLWEQEG